MNLEGSADSGRGNPDVWLSSGERDPSGLLQHVNVYKAVATAVVSYGSIF